jgi:hypothetical protein
VAEEAAGYGVGRVRMLERIEELKVWEREKEELLAWVTAMAEEHGLYVEPLKAVLGGELSGDDVENTWSLEKRSRAASPQ